MGKGNMVLTYLSFIPTYSIHHIYSLTVRTYLSCGIKVSIDDLQKFSHDNGSGLE